MIKVNLLPEEHSFEPFVNHSPCKDSRFGVPSLYLDMLTVVITDILSDLFIPRRFYLTHINFIHVTSFSF